MKKNLLILGVAFALGACGSTTKSETVEETSTDTTVIEQTVAIEETVTTETTVDVDTMAIDSASADY